MESMVVAGIVLPSEWDATGRVMAVTIAGFDEKLYLVADTGIGPTLIGHLRQAVSARGRVETVNGRMRLAVEGFTLVGIEESDRLEPA
jgi:hypothetical protein